MWGSGEMDDLLTVMISVIGSAVTSFLVAKYYGDACMAQITLKLFAFILAFDVTSIVVEL